MIKRTIYIGNRSKLKLENAQLLIELDIKGEEPHDTKSVPIEDIGILLVDSPQVSMSSALLNYLKIGRAHV